MASDAELLQIIDQALSETARKSGAWLVCKPGCWQCCIGAFRIHALDAVRLRSGLAKLRLTDPGRAEKLDARVAAYLQGIQADYPGDVVSGALREDPVSLEAFEEFANDAVCPVLDPASGTCDLYDDRPMTCRVFGPPVRNEEGLGVCELCYQGATPEEVEACELVPDPDGLEEQILETTQQALMARNAPAPGATIVAFALRMEPVR